MTDTAESAGWLREFSQTRSDAAFARLVARNLPLVYATALRRCHGQSGLASDVSQQVFIDLARKAPRLDSDLALAGWLHRHTCFVASSALRSETRRQRREELALRFHAAEGGADWTDLSAALDEALLELPASYREPLLLRFFEERPYSDVGHRLGLSENAARMRVERALDKLRAKLARRGVTSTASALAAGLTSAAVAPIPAGLAGSATASALAASVVAASGWGIFSFMSAHKTLSLTAAALLMGVPVLFQYWTGLRLRAENRLLREQLAAVESRRSAPAGIQDGDDGRSRRAELLRLRGEVAELRRRATALRPETDAATAPPAATTASPNWNTRARLSARETLVTPSWEWNGQAAVLFVTPQSGVGADQPDFQFKSTVVCAPADVLSAHHLASADPDVSQVVSSDAVAALLAELKQHGAQISETEWTTPGKEGLVHVGFVEDEYDQAMNFVLTPEFLGAEEMTLAVAAERRQLTDLELQIMREPDAETRRRLREQFEEMRRSNGP